jgi:hypothetical protein
MKYFKDLLEVGKIFSLSFEGIKSINYNLPFEIVEKGEDYVIVESYYSESEVNMEDFESDEELEAYIEENMELIEESSMVVRQELIIPIDKLQLLVRETDPELLDQLNKNKERYNAAQVIRKMFKNSKDLT